MPFSKKNISLTEEMYAAVCIDGHFETSVEVM
jgi:hypothetical protein